MDLKDYFDRHRGFGVLATADAAGRVNAAVYARPHVLEDGNLAMIMRDRLTHHNLQQNPHAAFLFRQDGDGYRGRRFHLTKIAEEQDSERIAAFKRHVRPGSRDADRGPLFLVTFRVDGVLPLIGTAS